MKSKGRVDFELSSEEISVVRQLLGQVAPTPHGNVAKLRAKLYAPLDGRAAALAREDVRFLHDLFDGLVRLGDDDEPVPRDEFVEQLIAKLAGALRKGDRAGRRGPR